MCAVFCFLKRKTNYGIKEQNSSSNGSKWRNRHCQLSPEFNIKVTSIEPGTVDTDLREDITDKELLEDKDYGGDEPKLDANAIARAVVYAVSEADEVNINEILIKPTGKS